jgi:hypothetical protein
VVDAPKKAPEPQVTAPPPPPADAAPPQAQGQRVQPTVAEGQDAISPDAANSSVDPAHKKGGALGADNQRAQGFAKEQTVGGFSRVYRVTLGAGENSQVKKGGSEDVPVLVFLPAAGIAPPTVDVFVFFHGMDADYGQTASVNEFAKSGDNPAKAAHMAESVAKTGRNMIALAPAHGDHERITWQGLQPSAYAKMVNDVLQKLGADLPSPTGKPWELQPGNISLAGHSAGGQALGIAAAGMGDHVKDVTLQDAGYGFNPSWEAMLEQWFLVGDGDKSIRVITNQAKNIHDGRDSGGAIGSHFNREHVKGAAKKHGLELSDDKITPDEAHSAGLHLVDKLVVTGKGGPRTIYIYRLYKEKGDKADGHFNVRNATMDELIQNGPDKELKTANS